MNLKQIIHNIFIDIYFCINHLNLKRKYQIYQSKKCVYKTSFNQLQRRGHGSLQRLVHRSNSDWMNEVSKWAAGTSLGWSGSQRLLSGMKHAIRPWQCLLRHNQPPCWFGGSYHWCTCWTSAIQPRAECLTSLCPPAIPLYAKQAVRSEKQHRTPFVF